MIEPRLFVAPQSAVDVAAKLIGAIAVGPMRQANYMLDRDTDKASLQDAVAFLAKATGLPER